MPDEQERADDETHDRRPQQKHVAEQLPEFAYSLLADPCAARRDVARGIPIRRAMHKQGLAETDATDGLFTGGAGVHPVPQAMFAARKPAGFAHVPCDQSWVNYSHRLGSTLGLDVPNDFRRQSSCHNAACECPRHVSLPPSS